MSIKISSIVLLLSVIAAVANAESLPGIKWMKKNPNMNGFTSEERQFMVDMHNNYRRAIAKRQFGPRNGAMNMREMVWSDNLARDAQRWAQDCNGWFHDRGSDRGYAGQNTVLYTDRTVLMEQAFIGWCDNEVSLYPFGRKKSNGKYEYLTFGSGHYTQVAWARSYEVGCGYAKCDGHFYGRLVCNYMNSGNFYEILVYKPGNACSDCDAGFGFCNDGLCSKSCNGRNCACKVQQHQCQSNGGRFDGNRCFCECPAGKKGLNCEKPCNDNNEGVYCDSNHCRRGSYYYHQMEAFCDKTCGLCR